MPMKVERSTHSSGAEVLQLSGALTLGSDAQSFEWSIEEQQTRIVVDMTEVSYLDSAGIGILMGCHGKVLNAGGEFRLAGLNERVTKALKLTRVDSILAIDADRDSAAQGMSASA